MALIKIELDYPLEDGMSLTFKAPCDCTAITGVKVYYPQVTETTRVTTSMTFSFKDTHLNTLNSLGNLFSQGSTVKIVVDTINQYAFIQNSDTNAYLENKFSEIDGGKVSVYGDTMQGALVAYNNTNYTTPQVRNIIVQSTVPSSIANGVIVGVYE